MNPIGVVICNYNKKDFVLQCVQSVLESKEKNFDIYVVDNASSDGSAEALKKAYGNRITVIENKENLGGSGGFNTGLRIVRDKGYSYFMCLDDDAAVDENALSVLYHSWKSIQIPVWLDVVFTTHRCRIIFSRVDYSLILTTARQKRLERTCRKMAVCLM